MSTLWRPLLTLAVVATPLLAGALRLEVSVPASQEVLAKHALLMAQVTACHSPEKSIVTATAEGVVNGIRKTVPLKVIALSVPGTFAVTREWPEGGAWAVRMVVTNPDYHDYSSSAVIPIRNNSVQLEQVKRYSHAPTEAEVALSLD